MFAVATIETNILHMCYEVEAFKDLRLMTLEELETYMKELKALSRKFGLHELAVGESTSLVCDNKHIYSLEILRVS